MKIEAVEEGFYAKGCDGKDIYIYKWNNIEQPKAVVQIFHGMAEHSERYTGFARFLNKNGFIVYSDDHRGHGKTAGNLNDLGYIGEDGFNRIIEDKFSLTEFIRGKHPDLPIFVFAHSFGSFLGQAYITKYGKYIDGIILSGSAARSKAEIALGSLISKIARGIHGEANKSSFVDFLCFGTYNKRIKNPKSKFAWLSRDEAEVLKYEADEYCGTIFTINYFYYLFEGLSELYKKKNFMKIPLDLPVYIMSGEDDPVGSYTKSVKKLYRKLKSINIKDIELKIYEGGRHEMLNETNREEVFEDIVAWLNLHIV